ncbi:2,5-dichloro-2,5-cyclohexadiene-1,4-diol dehydrogenase [uncultured Desulfobacterium sp.]|uniref:2,5-dichloro-2,5-cyclohexadiene-1,4-diol dehydrogenase n=1 Tax=uncultured Desulfobacterium sp. TaxID=201089 RepID=A0A445N066_9BACT|nr:2,5-dichloro-2,5-cyclohexadiene-1,4-diol dehydrogenase [uncultured Desulfobacterium sp.]
MQFKGKVALVTGAGSGIGRASAVAFAAQGAKVVVSDISEEGGIETVTAIDKAGGEAIFVKTDVSKPPEVEALINAIIKKYGRLDCAHNNAGITGNSTKVADCSFEEWNRVMGVNLTGIFLCMKYEIPRMIKQGGGAIVNTSSTMGVVAHGDSAAYVSSKHAVIGLTRSAALAYVRDNIRINALCPGNTETPIFDNLKKNMPAVFEGLLLATPIGRFAQPNEIANAVLWLCSDAASYCTGHAMVVDGCYTIQ